MTTQLGKRRIARRELPHVGTLLDNLPCSRLPTNGDVLRRLLYDLETNQGAVSATYAAGITLKNLKTVWEYGGYGDILQDDSNILKSIRVCKSFEISRTFANECSNFDIILTYFHSIFEIITIY